MAILYGITPEYMNGQEYLQGATLEQLYGEELGKSFLKLINFYFWQSLVNYLIG